MIYTPHQVLFRLLNQERSSGQNMWRVWGKAEVYREWWSGT